uniref:Homeobox domain-containing protein n=1 Tax=Strongyloides papillosus TaxID=174720 RepID=A0A0N5CA26_STREA
MSSNSSIVKDLVTIKVAIQQCFDSTSVIEKTVTLDPNTVLRDVRREVMKEYDLPERLADSFDCKLSSYKFMLFSVSILVSDMNIGSLNTVGSLFPSANSEMNTVSQLFERKPIVKIFLPPAWYNHVKIRDENRICKRLLQHVVSKIGNGGSQSTNTVIRYIANETISCPMSQLPYKTFLRMDKEMDREAESNVRSMDENAAPILGGGESNVDIDDSGVFTDQSNQVMDQNQRTTRIRFREEEIPLLERWYREKGGELPNDEELQLYTHQLNNVYNRSGNKKITEKKVFRWFSKKKYRKPRTAN